MSTEIVESVSVKEVERVVVQSEQSKVIINEDKSKVIITGIVGPKANNAINQANDIDLTGLTDGATLVYSTTSSKWKATNRLEKQIMEGGQY